MNNETIQDAYQAELDAFEQRYFHPTPPDGYYRVLSASGTKVPGLGWNCNKCKLQIPYNAPAEVKHCGGKISKRPGWWKRLRLPIWRIRVPE